MSQSAPERMTRVLNVCETARGGVGTYQRLLWATAGPATQHRFVAPRAHRGQLAAEMPVVTFADPGRGLRRLFHLFAATGRAAREFRPDVIFLHSSFTLPVLVALRALRSPARLVYCAHGWAAHRYGPGWKRRLVARAEGWMAGFADAVVNISRFDRDHALSHGYRGAHRLIENAAPEPEEPEGETPFAADPARLNLLFVGRLDRQKGFDILAEAFARARRSRPDLHLHVVGERVAGGGPLPAQAEGITFHGWVPVERVPLCYRAADLVVLPSRWEGLPLVIPEALRAGAPVLVSDRCALPGLVEPGRTGLVTPLCPTALAATLAALDKAALAAMRPACRASYLRRYSAERFGSEFAAFLGDLTGGGR